jgi:signal transduction histidine kinase
MGAPGTAGPVAPDRAGRPVTSQFVMRVIAPVAVLVVVWAVLAGVALAGGFARPHWLAAMTPSHRATLESGIVIGTALVVIIVAITATGVFTWRLRKEISSLAAKARGLADDAAGDDAGGTEIGSIDAALTSMHSAAITAADAEAGLRNGLRQVLVSLGRRNQALVHRQLRIIDTLEQQATSAAELSNLFTLDHLTTRMRRHAESLSVLAGETPGRSWSGPVPVIDVMRAAAAEVEDYKRVSVVSDAEQAVAAPAVTDMIHLLAELIENATLFSPSTTRVEVRAESVANGFVIEVEDRGLGIPAQQLREINERLASPPGIHLADADRLGLFVAARLASRHGVQVALCPSPYRGTKAVAVLPETIVVAAATHAGAAHEGASHVGAGLATGVAARLNLRAPEVLALAGAALAGPISDGAVAGLADEGPSSLRRQPGTRQGLPRRVRPDAGSARNTGNADAPGPRRGSSAAPAESPLPDEARTLAASLQRSWQLSRDDEDALPDDDLPHDDLPQRRDVPQQAGPSFSGPLPMRRDARRQPPTAPDSPAAPDSEETS